MRFFVDYYLSQQTACPHLFLSEVMTGMRLIWNVHTALTHNGSVTVTNRCRVDVYVLYIGAKEPANRFSNLAGITGGHAVAAWMVRRIHLKA